MRRTCLLAATLAAFALAAGAATLKDDVGREVEVVGPGKRIVTLSPFLTEIAFAVGAGGDVVAASDFSDHPKAARDVPIVSTAAGMDWELLAWYKPHLVIAWKESLGEGDIARLEKAGTRVFVVDTGRLADVPRAMRSIAALTGRSGEAQAKSFEDAVDGFRRQAAGKRVVDMFVEYAHRPLATVAGPHFINDALEACGAKNVFIDLPAGLREVQVATLVERNPEALFGAGSAADAQGFAAAWKSEGALSAVRQGKLVFVDADLIQRPTPRYPIAVGQLCAAVEQVRRKR
jgi:iron complex transport system substrate-binding protein